MHGMALTFGELYAAVTDLDRLANPSTRSAITQDIRDRMARVPVRISRAVARFLAADESGGASPAGPEVDMDATLGYLRNDPDPVRAQLMAGTFSSETEAGDAMMRMHAIRTHLLSLAPPSVRQTPAGAAQVQSQDFAGSEFRRAVQVAIDPMWAVDMFASGGLPRDVAESLWALYPTIAESLQEALLSQLADRQSGGREVELTRRQTLAVAALTQQLDASPDAAVSILRARAESEQPAPGPGFRPQTGPASKLTEQSKSATQRVESL